ncbi:hypothetical protein [Campylobacter sp. MG1]|uniref:hypothetical protein n=1 Tax=Campylobacter sp. MG1 TaxID=2976332 RepID=UPI00226D11B6|nr:hypothetical protein [Campylobacter sp. MG1]
MKAKNFLIYSILYIILFEVILILFFNESILNTSIFTLTIFNFSYNLELQNLIWINIPIIIYMIFSIIYFYYSFMSIHFIKKKLKKDESNFESFLEKLVLDKKEKYSFKTQEFKNISELIKNLYYEQINTKSNKLNSALALKSMLNNNEVCDLKPFKLNKDNSLYIKNEINKAKTDLSYAYNIIKNKIDINNEITLNAYINILNNDIYANIKMLKIKKSKNDVQLLLKRYYNDELKLSNAELEILISSIKFDENEYINIAKKLYEKIESNSLKAIFKKIQNENNEATRAYLYILAKLAEYDEIRDIIYSQENKFDDFELLIFLKEQGKTYNVDKLIF